ncbi:MAG TPA: undecaprenyldiphospho-muramoylpentapeptide beta-N-acetylglucosaminyltransferase [Bryobacteraceae bacterium]|nr:undecaprenyldiphospho-muramoylpentapeptide beta-N-acetylglucosaminyltransferase [Bryobacteraceae bacterium]
MTFLMAGGGTGGHVFPAIAVAGELRRRGHQPVFFGTARGYESRLVPAAGFSLELIEAGGLNRVGVVQKLRTVLQLPLAVARVWSWIGRHRPAAVFSMGGYVAGPVVLAAILRSVPLVAMEPNALPGLTTRRLARWTAKALVNFPDTVQWFPPGIAEVTGVPVREEFFAVPQRQSSDIPAVLVTGGSQGSRTLNNAGLDGWPRFHKAGVRVSIVHQAGRGNAAPLHEVFERNGINGEAVEFLADMPAAFAAADLVVCRAGASTVAELAAAGKPSILVPFPFAADDHQQKNAEAMQRAGAARVVADADFTGERLFEEVTRLLADREALRQMSENARALGKPGAAARAADVLEVIHER